MSTAAAHTTLSSGRIDPAAAHASRAFALRSSQDRAPLRIFLPLSEAATAVNSKRTNIPSPSPSTISLTTLNTASTSAAEGALLPELHEHELRSRLSGESANDLPSPHSSTSFVPYTDDPPLYNASLPPPYTTVAWPASVLSYRDDERDIEACAGFDTAPDLRTRACDMIVPAILLITVSLASLVVVFALVDLVVGTSTRR